MKPYFLDKDTFMASYVIGSQCVDYNRGNVDNFGRKERSSKFLGMEGRAPLKMQSSSDQVIPPTNSKVAHPIHRPAILEPNFFFLHIFLQIFPTHFPPNFSYTVSSKFFLWIFCCLRTNICSTSVCNAQSIRRTATLPILSSAL